MTTPLLAPPEAQPAASGTESAIATESLARPFRLGIVGLGAAVGLFVRLLAANGIGELNSSPVMLGAAATSALMGVGMLFMAAERDRFGAPLAWISLITALAWGALNWISPPFAAAVTVWSRPDQAVLAILGVGNGLLLAGIVVLAFVRRLPTLTVGATLISGTLALAADTVLLRNDWPAIVTLGIAFALILVAWDRSPRHELVFVRPDRSPRVSRAVLSFVSVALCGTAIQLWISRTDIPRAIPALLVSGVLIIGAFASLVRVRREIEQRDTTLSEWTSWFREVRTNDFRAEMQNFEATDPITGVEDSPLADVGGEAPRKLSFPGLDFAGQDSIDDVIQPAQPQAAPAGAFSASLAPDAAVLSNSTSPSSVADLNALAAWLNSPVAAARTQPLLVAIEAMSLAEFESLPPVDAAMATDEIGSFLADTMPDADLVSWIDGPYFIVAYASKPDAELLDLNKSALKSLKATDGTLALVRPSLDAELEDLVNECVMGLLHARRAKDHAAGR